MLSVAKNTREDRRKADWKLKTKALNGQHLRQADDDVVKGIWQWLKQVKSEKKN